MIPMIKGVTIKLNILVFGRRFRNYRNLLNYQRGFLRLDTSTFLKAYSIKEVSELLGVPAGTLRQWEKDLNIEIPRYKDGANVGSRYYTDLEINLLKEIKGLRDKKLSIKLIKEYLNRSEASENESEEMDMSPMLPNSLPTMTQLEAVERIRGLQEAVLSMQGTMVDMQKTFQLQMGQMQNFYESKLVETKNEILEQLTNDADQVQKLHKEIVEGKELQQEQLEKAKVDITSEVAKNSKQLTKLEKDVKESIKTEVSNGSEFIQKLVLGEKNEEEKIQSLQEVFKKQDEKQDKMLMESLRLTQEMKKMQVEAEKPWWKKIFNN